MSKKTRALGLLPDFNTKQSHLSTDMYSSTDDEFYDDDDDNDDADNSKGLDDMTIDGQMKKGLFAASRKPAKDSEIKNFQTLHSPRIHGMAEWLLQYETVCKRQDLYLQQIKELRQQLRTSNDSDSTVFGARRTRNKKNGFFWRPTVPLSPASLPEDKFANKACVLYPRRRRPKKAASLMSTSVWQHTDSSGTDTFSTPNLHTAPSPISAVGFSNKPGGKPPSKLPPIEGIDRNKTDYEPIEHIAKRNKLNLNKYLKGENWSRLRSRETMDVSDVCVQSTKIA